MTQAELAILTVLAEQPRHGYDIEAVIEERGFREWTDIGFSSIYYLLKKMEKEGLISGQFKPSQGQGAARKVYHLTDYGRAEHRKAVLQALSTPQKQPSPFLLGFANFPLLSNEESLQALKTYINSKKKDNQRLQENASAQGYLPDFVKAMFDYSLSMAQAEITWIEEWIRRMEENHAED